ncbi:MAG: hypothetical protein WCR72_15460 [Bacteroidota bacterium]
MSQQNNIAMVIPAEVHQNIKDELTKLLADFAPFLISLTADQKKSMPILGDSSIAFVNKALSYSETNPEFAPAFLNIVDMQIDVNAIAQLSPIAKLVQQLCDNITDTLTLSGSEAYIAALIYYNSVKQAAKNGIPGAKTIYEDLQKRFPGRPRTTNSGATAKT